MQLRVPQLPAILELNSSGWSPNRRRTREMVFSSTGDITRSKNSAGQNAISMRSAILLRRKLLNRPVSTITVALPAGFRALFPTDCRLSAFPLGKVSFLPVDPGWVDGIDGIAAEALIRDERRENLRGAFELAHLNQVAASSVLSTGTAASEGARGFGIAGAKLLRVRTVARKLRNQASISTLNPKRNS